MNLKTDRNKINIVMAKKRWNVPQLAEAYGVSRARMNIILNSQNLTSACVGREMLFQVELRNHYVKPERIVFHN